MSRPTDRFPINLALPSGDLFRARPKVSTLNLIDALENGWWHNKNVFDTALESKTFLYYETEGVVF